MSRTVACVLVLDGWAAAQPTLASIRGHGLDIAVGLIGAEKGDRPDDVEVHEIEWRDDFADARNRLADRLAADWLLWLNDDEELTAFAAPETGAPYGGVWIEDSAERTPRMAVRLQRRGEARWAGPLHETLVATGGQAVEVVDGIRLRVRCVQTRERHHAMASRGGEGHGFALAEARHAQASGPDAKTFMPWLRAYKLAAAQSTPPGAPDPRVEPAINLCAYDFTKPALELLRDSPEIAGLHYALLGADLMNGRRFDKARLNELSRRLAEARYDRRYGILRGLLAGAFRRIRHEIVASLIGDVDRGAAVHGSAGPLPVGRYMVISSPDEAPHGGRFQLRIDPGHLFGTGGHPSTRGALAALDELGKRRRFRRVLDLGAGSGILAIAAAKTWPARIAALDINPAAVDRTNRNFRANRLGARARASVTYGLWASRLPRGMVCDLCMVNLDAKYCIRFARAIRKSVLPGGVVVLSGFGNREERRVAGVYRALGMRLVSVTRLPPWSTMILEAPRATRPRAARPRARYRRARR